MIPIISTPLFFFSLVWSVGATCDVAGRKKFDKWLRAEMKKHQGPTPLLDRPQQGGCWLWLNGGGMGNSPGKQPQWQEGAASQGDTDLFTAELHKEVERQHGAPSQSMNPRRFEDPPPLGQHSKAGLD